MIREGASEPNYLQNSACTVRYRGVSPFMYKPSNSSKRLKNREIDISTGAVMEDTRCHDGFRIHRNPDNSYVFLEGLKGSFSVNMLTPTEARSLNACAKRRGVDKAGKNALWSLVRPPAMW